MFEVEAKLMVWATLMNSAFQLLCKYTMTS